MEFPVPFQPRESNRPLFPAWVRCCGIAILALTLTAGTATADGDIPAGGTTLAPVLPFGSGKAHSAIRLHNAGNVDGTATVFALAADDGQFLGSTKVDVRAHARVDLDSKSLQGPGGIALQAAFAAYVVSTFDGFVQNLTIGPAGDLAANVTSCGRDVAEDDASLSGAVLGTGGRIHYVQLFNHGEIPDAPSIRVYDADSGADLGIWNGPAVPPETMLTIAVADLPGALGLKPLPSRTALNLAFDAVFDGFMTHVVELPTPGRQIDLSQRCDLTAQGRP